VDRDVESKTVRLLNNFLIWLLMLVVVGSLVIAGTSSMVCPALRAVHRDAIAAVLAAEVAAKLIQVKAPEEKETGGQPAAAKGKKTKKGKAPSASEGKPPEPRTKYVLSRDSLPAILDKMNQHHLAWYYLTDAQGKLVPLTRSFAPELSAIEEKSRNCDLRGQSYYESVAPLQGYDYNLHVGFYNASASSADLLESELPLAAALAFLTFILLGTAILYLVQVFLPVRKVLEHVKRVDSGLPVKTLATPGASSEIVDLTRIVSDKLKMISDRDEMLKDRDNTIRKLNARFEQEMTQAKKEKTVLHLKEAENQFIDKLGSSLESITTVQGITESVLNQLHTEFPTTFEFALFFTINKKQDANLVSHIGFQNNPLEVYKGLGVMKGIADGESDQCILVEPTKLAESQFKEIAQLTGARFVVMCPLKFQTRRLALMVVFFRGQDQALEHITRVLNRAAHVCAKALHHIITYEEQVESSRTDELTGFPNKAYLPHLLPKILATVEGTEGEKRPFSIYLVEGHDVLAVNEKYGRAAGDIVIQELGKRIDRLLEQRRTETMGSWGDHIIRYQGAQFMIILRQVDSKKAVIFAQRLRQVLEADDYPCGVGKWQMSIGITSFPEDSTNVDEIILNVETALSYARGQTERNKIAHISSVPKAFRSAKLASNLGGSLDVFDPAALLQSLSISRKSGILTVTHPEGKMFWCFLENGRPTKARMSKFTGQPAIIEFLVLFEAGEFAFTDLASIDKQTLDDIGRLPKTFECKSGLERMLMDGALARDHFAAAQKVIKETGLFVWPQPGARNGEGFAKLKSLSDPPTEEEEKVMKQILAACNGKVQLKAIFDRMDSMPTSTVWRSAAFLVQHDMVQLKKLATNIAL
jgi:diguanylate cyclase (GGDEF)-like protein